MHAQSVVPRAVVDFGLDVDAWDARVEGDAGYDLAVNTLLRPARSALRETQGQRVGHADFEGVASRALFKHADVRRRKG